MIEPSLTLRRSPYPDELLSSWLIRTIQSYGGEPHAFCKIAFPDFEVWNRDIDRFAPVELLRQIDQLCNFETGTAEAMTLRQFIRDTDEEPVIGRSLLLLSAGINSRDRRRHGLQYCAQCLCEDSGPSYFRKHWRCAFLTVCLEHLQPLVDACPHCDAPVVPHRALGLRPSRCHACEKSLLHGGRTLLPSMPINADLFDAYRYGNAFVGARDASGHRKLELSARDYFFGIRCLISLIYQKSRESLRAFDFKGHFEDARITDRYRVMRIVNAMLLDWPTSFVVTCDAYGITQRVAKEAAGHPPSWIAEGFAQLKPGRIQRYTPRETLPQRLVRYQRLSRGSAHYWKQQRAGLLLRYAGMPAAEASPF